MKRRWIVAAAAVLALGCCGCSQQERAQRELIGGMQNGLKDLAQWQEQRQGLLDELFGQRRRMLDAAFDEDVEKAQLDAAWVIEHRKAYVTALEAMWRQQMASQQAQTAAAGNVATLQQGLARLRWMSEMRENWISAVEDVKKEVEREQD